LECVVPRMTHDLDAIRLGGNGLTKLLEHFLRLPGRILLDDLDPESVAGRQRTVRARPSRAIAGVAAHLHVHHHALAEWLCCVRGRTNRGESSYGGSRGP